MISIAKYYIKQYDSLYSQYSIYKYLKKDIIKQPMILNYKYFLNNVKKSDTLFILGSGASINEMTEKNFKWVQKNDSVGFNNWVLHEFVPVYYFIDFKKNNKDNENASYDHVHNILHRYHEYRNVHFVLRLNRSYPNFIEPLIPLNNLQFGFQIGISGANTIDYMNNLKFLISTSLINKNHVFYNKNSSVHNSILFAYKMRYNKIVLCGIDLSNVDYFHQLNKESIKARGLIIPPSIQTAQIHKTNDPANCSGGLPISKIITVLDEVLLKPNKIKLYIATKKSALYPQIPLYKW